MAAQSRLLSHPSLLHLLLHHLRRRARQRRTPLLLLAIAAILLLRARIVTAPRDALRALRAARGERGKTLSKEERARALQQVYVEGPGGEKTLLVPFRENIVKVRARARVCCFCRAASGMRLTESGGLVWTAAS